MGAAEIKALSQDQRAELMILREELQELHAKILKVKVDVLEAEKTKEKLDNLNHVDQMETGNLKENKRGFNFTSEQMSLFIVQTDSVTQPLGLV